MAIFDFEDYLDGGGLLEGGVYEQEESDLAVLRGF